MRKTKYSLKLPVAYVDISAGIDRRLLLPGEMMAMASSDPEPLLGFSMLQELSSELHRYLRARCALEVCVGRTAPYFDDEIDLMVWEYRNRLGVA